MTDQLSFLDFLSLSILSLFGPEESAKMSELYDLHLSHLNRSLTRLNALGLARKRKAKWSATELGRQLFINRNQMA